MWTPVVKGIIYKKNQKKIKQKDMPIHTLMFGWEYPPLHYGGLGVACQGLVRGLLKNGIRVTLVLPNGRNISEEGDFSLRSPTKVEHETIRVQSMLQPYDDSIQYAMRARALPQGMENLYGSDIGSAVENFTKRSMEIVKDIHPDIVHCHDWMTYEAGIRVAHHHQKPLVAHIHATEFDRTDFHPNQWIAECERRGLQRADRIIAVSNYTKNILTEQYGIHADKVCVVHNGSKDWPKPRTMAIDSQYKKKRSPMVLFLGRLTIQKGPWHFLDMAAKVHAIRPDVEFVMAGDGHMFGELVHRAYQLGIADRVLFTGRLGDDGVDTLYKQADCFVMPSLSEPFGLVALEAIARGTPVVISKQSGVGEVIQDCFKVDFWDTELMADCVLTILREQPLAEQLRSEAPRVLRHITWQNQAKAVQSIYEQLMSSF